MTTDIEGSLISYHTHARASAHINKEISDRQTHTHTRTPKHTDLDTDGDTNHIINEHSLLHRNETHTPIS